jgi:hypothetical protein
MYMLLLGMLLWKVGMNLTHDWTSTHETMQCPISVSQKAYSGWKSVRKKCTAFDIRQEWGTHYYWLQASLQVGKAHHERKHWCHWSIMVLLIPGLDWALCRLYASFLQFGKKNLLLFCHLMPNFVLEPIPTRNVTRASCHSISC